MDYIKEGYLLTANTIKKNFEKRNLNCIIVNTKEEAKEAVLNLIPKGASVSWGGSESLKEAGICEGIKNGDYNFIDRNAGKTKEETKKIWKEVMTCDYFLTSTNAFTKDGELVNIDGTSNRVACICYGPDHVVVVTSMNKLCENVDEAINRIKTHACPPNAMRVGAKTPCSTVGVCHNCLSPDCVCCETLITRFCRDKERFTIILSMEKLGY